ncbi:MAG: hypothetical protein AB1564_16640 [Chloroflexota bacterium]
MADWNFHQSGNHRYYSQAAGNLYQAAETLKAIPDIPGLTYYVVDTPDGTLGRDMNGFYTEAPIKTRDIAAEASQEKSDAVECSSLTEFGNMFQNQVAVAQIIRMGQYARLVLLMKCGNCNYESPVETQAGPFTRECYYCGVENQCHRASINVVSESGAIEI